MRPFLLGLTVFVVGLVIFEVSMQPSGQERLELGLIFFLMALAIGAAAWWLPVVARRSRSLRITITLLSLASFLIVVGGATAVANRMFFSEHDFSLLMVVLAFGVLAAAGLAVVVARPLTADVDVVAETAERVAGGDLAARARLDRHDEVGSLATSMNQMIGDLEDAEAVRQADAEARRTFFSALGHDLRTPLASLRVVVEAFQDGLIDDPHPYLASMERDVAALSSLVEDLFLLSRLDAGVVELTQDVVDVTEIADEAIDILEPIASSRGVTVRLHATDRVVARGSVEALGRVMRNLIDNAVRHAPAGSEVSVEVSGGAQGATVRVLDEGVGFDAAFVPVAFDSFTREDPARGRDTGGAGLGLAIAKGFVVALDGRIWAEPGPGGRVCFEMPAAM